MKYTVMGFSQQAILEIIEDGHKIDASDLLILRWLVDFSHTDKMVKVVDEGRTYYWISYQSLLDDIPMLNIGKRMLANRLQKMVEAGLLISKIHKVGGTFTMYGFGERYSSLICNDEKKISSLSKEFAEGCKNIDIGGANKFTEGVSINLQPKYTSTNNTSTNNQSTNIYNSAERKNQQKHKYGEYNNVLLTDEELQRLQAEFSADWHERIERLSGYIASTGKAYKSHFATIRNWAKKEVKEPKEAIKTTGNPFLDMLARSEAEGVDPF